MEDGDGVLGEDGADDDRLLEGAVALLAQRDQETLEERAGLEQGLPDRLEKRQIVVNDEMVILILVTLLVGLIGLE